MLSICEKANRVYRVIQWFKVLLSIMIKPQRYKILYQGTDVFAEKLIKSFNSYLRVVGFFFFFTFLSLTMRKIQHPSLILGSMDWLLGTSTTHSDLFSQRSNIKNSREKETDEEVKCQIRAKAMYSGQNNARVVGSRVILCSLKARKQNYSGGK